MDKVAFRSFMEAEMKRLKITRPFLQMNQIKKLAQMAWDKKQQGEKTVMNKTTTNSKATENKNQQKTATKEKASVTTGKILQPKEKPKNKSDALFDYVANLNPKIISNTKQRDVYEFLEGEEIITSTVQKDVIKRAETKKNAPLLKLNGKDETGKTKRANAEEKRFKENVAPVSRPNERLSSSPEQVNVDIVKETQLFTANSQDLNFPESLASSENFDVLLTRYSVKSPIRRTDPGKVERANTAVKPRVQPERKCVKKSNIRPGEKCKNAEGDTVKTGLNQLRSDTRKKDKLIRKKCVKLAEEKVTNKKEKGTRPPLVDLSNDKANTIKKKIESNKKGNDVSLSSSPFLHHEKEPKKAVPTAQSSNKDKKEKQQVQQQRQQNRQKSQQQQKQQKVEQQPIQRDQQTFLQHNLQQEALHQQKQVRLQLQQQKKFLQTQNEKMSSRDSPIETHDSTEKCGCLPSTSLPSELQEFVDGLTAQKLDSNAITNKDTVYWKVIFSNYKFPGKLKSHHTKDDEEEEEKEELVHVEEMKGFKSTTDNEPFKRETRRNDCSNRRKENIRKKSVQFEEVEVTEFCPSISSRESIEQSDDEVDIPEMACYSNESEELGNINEEESDTSFEGQIEGNDYITYQWKSHIDEHDEEEDDSKLDVNPLNEAPIANNEENDYFKDVQRQMVALEKESRKVKMKMDGTWKEIEKVLKNVEKKKKDRQKMLTRSRKMVIHDREEEPVKNLWQEEETSDVEEENEKGKTSEVILGSKR